MADFLEDPFALPISGARPGSEPLIAQTLALFTLVAVLASMPAYVAWETWSEFQAVKAAWTIPGEPCPVVDQPAPWAVNHHRKPRSFAYGGAIFTRSFGAVSCVTLAEPGLWANATYPVCQFNNAGFVAVATHERKVLFQPPVGKHTTVSVRRGVAHCVVGGWFSL